MKSKWEMRKMISSTDLKKIVEEFSSPREEFNGKSYINRRREWFDKPMQEIRPLLLEGSLDSLTLDDANKIYKEMSVGGPKLYPHTFIENGLEPIKKSLKYLLYGKDPLEERFHNFAGNLDSEYYIKGVGRAFASTALFLIDHYEYAIWNGAIDGGLNMLGMLPKRERGEHMGQTYIKIMNVVKKLQKKCGFKDLSLTDEFIELIYHNTIGSDVLSETSEELGEEIDKATEQDEKLAKKKGNEDIHLKNQYYLAKIGQMRGYDIWIAYNDKNKSYDGENLNSISLNELPHFAGPNVLQIAKSIDVIWFKKGSAQPVSFFEIEHTTSIYSGLLRFNDVKIDYPIPKAYIVGPKERKNSFDAQMQRRTFVYSELSEICQYMSYDDVDKLLNAYKNIDSIL